MLALEIETAENAVRAWLTALSNIQYYPQDINLTRPAGLYGTYNLFSAVRVGTPFIAHENAPLDKVKLTYNTNNTIVMSINTYRKGARQALQLVRDGVYLSLPLEILEAANLGFVSISDMRDLTSVIEGNLEERAQVDITFNAVGGAEEETNPIETVPIESINLGLNFEVKA